MKHSCLESGKPVLEKDTPCQQELFIIKTEDHLHLYDEPEGEFNFDEESSSSFSIAKFVSTSITSLITTCGIGFFVTSKAEPVNTVDKPLSASSDAVAESEKHPVSLNHFKPTPTKPEAISNSLQSSTLQETKALVRESLAEYYMLLNHTTNTSSSEMKISPQPYSEISRNESIDFRL